jgi:hypothetical protein
VKLTKVAPVVAQYAGAAVIALGIALLVGLAWGVIAAGLGLLVLGTVAEVTS